MHSTFHMTSRISQPCNGKRTAFHLRWRWSECSVKRLRLITSPARPIIPKQSRSRFPSHRASGLASAVWQVPFWTCGAVNMSGTTGELSIIRAVAIIPVLSLSTERISPSWSTTATTPMSTRICSRMRSRQPRTGRKPWSRCRKCCCLSLAPRSCGERH